MPPPLQPQHTPPSTAQTIAVEMLIWARFDLLEARTAQEISYCRRVIERRLAAYRLLMEHPGSGVAGVVRDAIRDLRPKPNGEYK